MLVFAAAYIIRPWVTDDFNRRYFLPALSIRIIGALAVGFIYQFYYEGGDTFNYHTHGSRHIWEAFWDSPAKAWKFFFYDKSDVAGIYQYSKNALFLSDPGSFTITRVAFLFDLFTFSTYSATAVLFAVFSFAGMWCFFLTFYKQYPHQHLGLAIASFFIPSVFFWGSGLLKDTVTLASLGIATYMTYRIFIAGKFSIWNVLILVIALYLLYQVKIYILLTFLPSAIFWILLANFGQIRSVALKILVFPMVLTVAFTLGYYSIVRASEDNAKYSIDMLARTAQVTAQDIHDWTGKDSGSKYSLGDLDGSFSSMMRMAPQAINASLFRPYLWEVKNPLMFFSALESFTLLVLFLFLVFRVNFSLWVSAFRPNVVFCWSYFHSFSHSLWGYRRSILARLSGIRYRCCRFSALRWS